MSEKNIFEKYSEAVKKIKRKRTILAVTTIIAIFTAAILSGPITVSDGTVIKEGLPLPVTLLIIAFIFFVELIFAAAISSPIIHSLYTECDPEKRIVLSEKLLREGTQKSLYISEAFFTMGNFEASIKEINKLINRGKHKQNPNLIFQKARCEFFMGDYNTMRESIGKFHEYRASTKKTSAKQEAIWNKYSTILELFLAIADDDRERIGKLGKAGEPWFAYKITEGFVAYLKGLSAHLTGEKNEAVYHLTYVSKNLSKTFMSDRANEILSKYNNLQ